MHVIHSEDQMRWKNAEEVMTELGFVERIRVCWSCPFFSELSAWHSLGDGLRIECYG